MVLHPLISDKYQFILFWNGKCACTSLKHWFAVIHDITVDTWEHISWFGEDRSIIPYRSDDAKEEFLAQLDMKYKNYRKYIVTRDPCERLASAYICDIAYGANKTTINNPTFKEYVDYFYNHQNKISNDDHTCKQSEWLQSVQFDKIIDIHDINVEFEQICIDHDIAPVRIPEKIHVLTVKRDTIYDDKKIYDMRMNQFIISANFSRFYVQNRAVYIPSYDRFFNDDIRNKIHEIYKDDYEFISQ